MVIVKIKGTNIARKLEAIEQILKEKAIISDAEMNQKLKGKDAKK